MSAETVIRLSDGLLNVEILPEAGGRIAAFWSEAEGARTDWFVPRPHSGAAGGGSTAWGSFPLVPFSNRIRDGHFVWNGEEHTIAVTEKSAPHAIHGHGRAVPWNVDALSDTRAELSYAYPGEDWPFPYRARQVLDLAGGTLGISMALENTGATSMPGGLGHHPYLPWRGGPMLETRFDSIWPAVDGVLPAGPETVPGDLEFSGGQGRVLVRGLDTGFGGWGGHAQVRWPAEGLSLEINGSDTLAHAILFTPEGRPFFCVEPVTHCIDAINLAASGVAGTGMQAVLPGESIAASMRFRPGIDKR